jgi:uncharacterized membrane protein YraQ (UPF0718 family)
LGQQVSLNNIIDVFSCCVLNWTALTTMLPAFLLAGAITAFIPAPILLKYLGSRKHRVLAYIVAASSGAFLPVCSCNVVPLFLSIYRRGAGIGPAFTFLYAAPAIHIVSIVFTYQVIGWRLGLWRVIGVPAIALVVGPTMGFIFRREEQARMEQLRETHALATDGVGNSRRLIALFGLLFAAIVLGSWNIKKLLPGAEINPQYATLWTYKLIATGILAVAIAIAVWRMYDGDEIRGWLRETFLYLKMVIPLLIPAILIIGFVATAIDIKLVSHLFRSPGADAGALAANLPILRASGFSALMYFPVLAEVAFTKAFLKEGMIDVAPALAVLLTGAGISLPGGVLISRGIGVKKTVIYFALIITSVTLFCSIFNSRFGQYICDCMLMH